MSALLAVALATLVPLAAPTSESATAPLDRCLALVKAGDHAGAQRCYDERARAAEADAAIASELAALVGTLRLTPPADLAPPPPNEVALLFSSGKAELIGTSTLVGAYVAELGLVATAIVLSDSWGAATSALFLLAPVAGGATGLAVSAVAALNAPGMTPGDANAVRALTLLGTFDSILLPLDLAAAGASFADRGTSAGIVLGMAVLQVAGVGAGVIVAVTTDLPEAAGSLAISAGLWTTVLSLLGANMAELYKQRPEQGAFLVTVAGNVGFVAGMVASPWLPMTRAETWALDVGGGAGLLASASLALLGNAPNPFIGYGTMATGTLVGMAAGFAAARFLPAWVETLPTVVASPVVLPDGDRLVLGGGVTGRF